jgi:hypothetical protein
MFNSEVHELIDSLLYHLEELEQLSGIWQSASRRAKRAGHIRDSRTRDSFDRALRRQLRAQTKAFDAIEAFLAAWARLSLLFFPSARRPKARNRGEVLRKVYLVDARTSPLADRQLRNAWMHFDERIDHALETRTLGNRHQFTTGAHGTQAAARSVRVVEMDNLVVRYRDASGTSRKTDLRELRRYLDGLNSQFRKTQRRFRILTGAA